MAQGGKVPGIIKQGNREGWEEKTHLPLSGDGESCWGCLGVAPGEAGMPRAGLRRGPGPSLEEGGTGNLGLGDIAAKNSRGSL